ncbi:MAG: hypothetical protein WCO04_01200 [Pseudomonadota bacterium]
MTGPDTGNVVSGVIGLRTFIHNLCPEAVIVVGWMEFIRAAVGVHLHKLTAKLLPKACLLETRRAVVVKSVGQ